MNEKAIPCTGRVLAALANCRFAVAIDGTTDHQVLARLCGRLVKNYITVVVGDDVELEVSPYDLTRGRITRRF
ncbi:translation initiation factor IF-1 [Anatilimnocola floriformis]|uniref:translation initiation factor IF-1 n=1 Tax=Anatilimnocola floriformis TaxID=2948575 RepID=UPI0020C4C195|nr:translation initiation factor IF-1 [Anatilimnocola floriformis]